MVRTKASIAAQKRYDDKTFDSILVKAPKGTKDRIKAMGIPVNRFIVNAILTALDNTPPTAPGETTDDE